MTVQRASGDIDESMFFKNSTEISISYHEVPNLSLQNILEKLDNVAKDMADQVQKTFYLKINEDLDRMGRTVDYKNKPFSAEAILAALESIQIEFNDDGKHNDLQIHIAPQFEEAAKKAFHDLENDPNLKKRH